MHKPCEDSFACSSIVDADGNEILVCVASDGAGSARRAGLGSKRVVSAFSKFIHLFVKLGSRISDLTQLDVSEWIARFQHDLSLEATKENYLLRDYMSTLLVAILAKEEAVFFQIGDGAIVVNAENPLGNNDYETVFWPERGQYDNTTFFVTQSNAIDHLQLTFMQRPINRMAMFTDGMQSLALDLKATRTHAPFFEGLFEAVEFYVKKKREHAASTFLKSFLGSERVNRRTDDDKTLILAMRSLLEESKTRQDNYTNESNQEENSESSLH